MANIYIEQAAGEFCEFDEGDPMVGAAMALPHHQRPVIRDATHPAVIEWLNRVARAQITPVDQARSVAATRTVKFANTIRERIAASKHYLQAARWPIQLAAAQAIKAGNGSDFDVSIMAREARLRGLGETVEQLADKVLANSLVFASTGAAVDGIERATLDAIAAYAGNDPTHFETILANAKSVALTEFLDIFGAVYGLAQAQAMAVQFFGPLEAAE